jgi:hypothetical protein
MVGWCGLTVAVMGWVWGLWRLGASVAVCCNDQKGGGISEIGDPIGIDHWGVTVGVFGVVKGCLSGG